MERRSIFPRSSASLSSLLSKEEKFLLPPRVHRKSKFRLRTLLGHCLYRRLILWTAAGLSLLCLAVTSQRSGTYRERLFGVETQNQDVEGDLAKHNPEGASHNGKKGIVFVITTGSEKAGIPLWQADMPKWLKFRHLDGFYVGLKALVSASEYKPEHPRPAGEDSPYPLTVSYTGLPTPTPFVPQPDYQSADYTAQYHEVAPCYLDKENKIPIPDLYAYDGIIQGQSEPVMGSHSLLGLRGDICFDRFGRYGAYGLGYSLDEGGMGVGLDTEREGSEAVWEKSGKINYDAIDWGDAQTRCYESNKKRFIDVDTRSHSSSAATPTSTERPSRYREHQKEKIPRTAVVIRAYAGFQWTHHAVLNFRAMISELSLRSGGEYAVHFLLHVRDDEEAIWADPITAQRVLDDYIPEEFHSITTLWSEDQMRLIYPGDFGNGFANPSGADIHGVYRSAHMALQHFALNHPEYEHFWNWELDVRWLGNYYELFDRLGKWAKQQSRVEAWERSARYYIPRYHGDWANFTALVHNETLASGTASILGPVSFPGRLSLRAESDGANFLPPNCPVITASSSSSSSPSSTTTTTDTPPDPNCGVGEDADLITLNPLFDADGSNWVFQSDISGYDTALPQPPRRAAIVTASRLSRRLLAAMHEETWRLRHTMFSEMFPASVALHHGLKALFAPHPVLLDREWDLGAVDAAFNGGKGHTAGGKGSPFDLYNEHNHKGTSWYYHSEFAGLLWRRWLGYAEHDGRGENGGRAGEGTLRGGREEEESATGTGRMCLRSMLVHPIKWEHPGELEDYDD